MNEQWLDWLRSGAAFKPEQAFGDGSHAALGEAVRVGLARHMANGLFADFRPEFLVAQASRVAYDEQGRSRAVPVLPGDVRVLSQRRWLRVVDTGAVVAPFSVATLLLPGQQTLGLEPTTQTGGVLEVVLTSDRPIRDQAWKPEHRDMEILVYCDVATAADLDDFRLLGMAPWTIEGRTVDVRLGVPSAVAAPECWRSPVGKLLGRAQPIFAGRFLRIPVEPWIDHAGDQVRFQVRLGGEAARVAAALAGRLLLHCVPVWNAPISAVEPSRAAADEKQITIEPPRQDCRSILILECFERGSGRTWCDERFAGHRDPISTFRLEMRDSVADLHFKQSLRDVAMRIVFMAGLGELRDIQAGVSWLTDDAAEQLLVRSEPIQGQELCASWGDDFVQGRAVTERELVDLLWRLMPTPVRRKLDERMLEAMGVGAIRLSHEIQRAVPRVGAAPHDVRATPVTKVTFPAQPGAATDELAPWLQRWALHAQQFCSYGERLEICLAPAVQGAKQRSKGG